MAFQMTVRRLSGTWVKSRPAHGARQYRGRHRRQRRRRIGNAGAGKRRRGIFAGAVADVPVVKQGAVGAHAGEIVQGMDERNAALADHRPDQRCQLRQRMGVDDIRPEIIDDAGKPAHETRIQLHGELVVFSLPSGLLFPVPDKNGVVCPRR